MKFLYLPLLVFALGKVYYVHSSTSSTAFLYTEGAKVLVLETPALPGPAAEFGFRKASGFLSWEAGLGLVGVNAAYSAESGTFDSVRLVEPFPFPVSDPESFYSYFSAYHLAFRCGPEWRLGPSAVYAMAGLLPHFVSYIHADTVYIPSETTKGKSIFMSEYYLDRYFGLGFDFKTGFRYSWWQWNLGLQLGYTWWSKYQGASLGFRIERAISR